MRHRDILPGKPFELPPSRGKSILSISQTELKDIITISENDKEEIVRVLARKVGGGGALMEEILVRAIIPKNKVCSELKEEDIQNICSIGIEISSELEALKPSMSLDNEGMPIGFHPIEFKSNPYKTKPFSSFSGALDSFYSHDTPIVSSGLSRFQQRKKQLEKVLLAQQKTLEKYKEQQELYKKIGDTIYLQYTHIDELLKTILKARKKNTSWEEIEKKLKTGKEKSIPSAQLFDKINPQQGTVHLDLELRIIEVDFRHSATEIASGYYEKAKKASRKIPTAEEAIQATQEKLTSLSVDIKEQTISDAIVLKRRKRSWFEKYHWTISENNFLIIGGKDISSNEEIAKKRMKKDDLFFHAEVQGAPYTVLIRDSSEKEIITEDINLAATLAASFSSAWKAGYGAIDVYYVSAENVSFSAPSGEYIPKGGIMVRGNRNYLRGINLRLAIGFEEDTHNVKVIYGSEKQIRKISPVVIIIKPGDISKGKIAKQIQNIFLKRAETSEQKAKLKALDLNEIVQAIPHNSNITEVV
jgi:predicted ribosome quality control (RQC) complex YloA/Tae2 family protein